MKVILVDGNAVGYSSQQTRSLSTSEGEPTQAIFHSIKSIWNLKKRYPKHKILVLWDSHAQWRYDLLPEYKGKREQYPKQIAMREEYRLQRPHIQKALELMGVCQLSKDNYEADDIAGVYACKLAAKDDCEVVLYTGDKDWMQLVSDNVIWHSIDTDKRISSNNLERETGFKTPIQYLQAKALHGDTSDNISGVGGIGEKTADKLMKEFGSLKSLLKTHAERGDFEKGYFSDAGLDRVRNKINKLCRNESNQLGLFKRNIKLMNLHTIPSPPDGFVRNYKQSDKAAFIDFCLHWEMTSMMDKIDTIFTDLGHTS